MEIMVGRAVALSPANMYKIQLLARCYEVLEHPRCLPTVAVADDVDRGIFSPLGDNSGVRFSVAVMAVRA